MTEDFPAPSKHSQPNDQTPPQKRTGQPKLRLPRPSRVARAFSYCNCSVYAVFAPHAMASVAWM